MLIVSIAGYADDSASLIGSRIQINGRAFVAVSLLGIGGLGSVYLIESEARPHVYRY